MLMVDSDGGDNKDGGEVDDEGKSDEVGETDNGKDGDNKGESVGVIDAGEYEGNWVVGDEDGEECAEVADEDSVCRPIYCIY